MTDDKELIAEANMVVFSNYKIDQIHPPPSYRRPDRTDDVGTPEVAQQHISFVSVYFV
jgi:hypothetical protein